MSARRSTVRDTRALVRGLAILVRAAPIAVTSRLVLLVIGGLTPAAVFATLAVVVNRLPQVPDSPDAMGSIVLSITGLTALLAVSGASSGFEYFLDFVLSERFTLELQQRVMRGAAGDPTLERLEDPAWADRLELSSWVRQGPDQVVSMVGTTIAWGSMTVATAVVSAMLSWWAPLFILAATVPDMLRGWWEARDQASTLFDGATDLRKADYLRKLAVEMEGAKEIRLFGLEGWVLHRQHATWDRGIRAAVAVLHRYLVKGLIFAVPKMALISVPFGLAFLAARNADVPSGTLAGSLLALTTLIRASDAFSGTPGYLLRVGRFLPEAFELADLAQQTNGAGAPLTATGPGAIRLEGVRFHYPGTDQLVLDGVDLEIPAGTSLALVGENGSGKSTLIKLLCRLYEADGGRILWNGVDTTDLDRDMMRRNIAAVFQDYVHWPLSAADNVGFGCIERRDDAELLDESARLAGADRIVRHLPSGWETTLARQFGGTDLSSGQWQRVALARTLATALGRDASLLILDEPTAALDVRVEQELYERFADVTAGRTTLLVSHRLSTVRMADRIAVLEAGRIVEHGSHDELLAAGGRYAELWRLQAQRFTVEGQVP